jgi:hypothetical protein
VFPLRYEINTFIFFGSVCVFRTVKKISVFVCSVWLTKQTISVSPNGINRLGFAAEELEI